mmetsp:Transcript_33248/g.67077  ORF Transcript_33248/g.67077 Transcript_33248/m.67077 type:complete len:1318 (-) Transcript_33248:2390-6343(-)
MADASSATASSTTFPFGTVVVTSPSFTSSSDGPLSHLAKTLPPNVRVLGTSDPYGARCGSGGGTIAALDYADAADAYADAASDTSTSCSRCSGEGVGSVLIVHAGGESSRCPTQMVLGKAWSSLPVAANAAPDINNNSTASSITDVGSHAHTPPTTPQNPTALLISELSTLLRDLPRGSVVVAASDVILALPSGVSFDFTSRNGSVDDGYDGYDDAAVIGLAVPAPLATAKNHGVYVLEPCSEHDVHDDDGLSANACSTRSTRLRPRTVTQFLQKPSPDVMRDTPHCTFEGEDCAWIDTGVVVFLPEAAAKLRELAAGALACCTHRGLEAMYRRDVTTTGAADAAASVGSDTVSMEDYAQANTAKVELYTHLMMALSTTRSLDVSCGRENGRLEAYVSEHTTSKISAGLLAEMYTILSPLTFRAAAIPAGRFVHLGTTSELLDFLVDAAAPASAEPASRSSLGQKLGLCGRFNSFLLGVNAVGDKNVVLSSAIVCSDANKTSEIGSGTVVEHTSLTCPRLIVGNDCLVSALRGSSAYDVLIPDGMCIQMLPLRKSWGGELCDGPPNSFSKGPGMYFVCLYLAVADSIKSAERIYGLPIGIFTKAASLNESDLWDDSLEKSERMLWNAKVHPVVWMECSNNDAKDVALDLTSLKWISELKTSAGHGDALSEENQSSLELWRSLPRLSLSEIRNVADSYTEREFRDSHETAISEARCSQLKQIVAVMHGRKHTPTDFSFVANNFGSTRTVKSDVREALSCIDGIVLSALKDGHLDVAGRGFMLMGCLVRDLAETLVFSENDDTCGFNEMQWQKLISALRFSYHSDSAREKRMEAASSMFSLRDQMLQGEIGDGLFQFLATSFEQASFALTAVCVGSSNASLTSSRRRSSFENTDSNETGPSRSSPIPAGSWAVATAPARVDLSGGWSDTPPISYEYGGAVTGIAVRLDGKRPLSARCRVVPSSEGVVLRSEGRNLQTGTLQVGDADFCTLRRVSDLADFRDPRAKCALLKCALVYLGLVSLTQVHADNDEDLQPYINDFCQSSRSADVGLEVISTSLLPKGSGLGASSILGGCILAAIERCVGSDVIGLTTGDDNTVDAVLTLEQLLTTGGGWQDQVNGLVGGVKIGRSDQSIPLRTTIERIPIDPSMRSALDQRLLLAFSGQPRLAKNILVRVLRRWGQRTSEITKCVQDLVEGAKEAADAARASDIDRIGKCLGKYWELKKIMAGLESGVEPPVVAEVLKTLTRRKAIVGGSLCGAGGGGFMAVITSEGVDLDMIRNFVEITDDASFSWHRGSVDETGLSVLVEGPDGSEFDIGWHN